ncbi:MAG: TerD family protein, partial [Proteobacteria bacterium]|nr:TerD family protein [Pseudomonadota bacterium]
ERLHPGEHATRFPRAAAAFARLRNDQRPATFASTVEAALRAGDVAAALAILRTRPGELARRLDHLLRLDAAQRPNVLVEFARGAPHVSTPVLLQVLSHFEFRPLHEAVRPIFPKGNAAKLVALPNTLPPLPAKTTAAVVATCEATLVMRFHVLPPLGTCFIDPRLAHHLVPFSQRSASKALRTLVRGSRLPLPKGSTLRFFLWWKEGQVDGVPTGRVDVDLSAIMFGPTFDYLHHLSWTSLRAAAYHGVHSGDITSAPDGACEFIDLDLKSVRAHGIRYIVVSALAFTSQPFCNLPECFLGWMMRREPGSGEIFEPATVVDRVDLAANQRIAVPAIFDVETREIIWTDVGFARTPVVNTVEAGRTSLAQLVQGMAAMHRTTLARLFELHVRARGKRVAREAKAETVFGIERGITPFDTETIMARFLI